MSRLGKKPIVIPAKTEFSISAGTVVVKGQGGTLTRDFRTAKVNIVSDGKEIKLSPAEDSIEARALWGTYSSHIRNMIQGVNTPYQKKLIIEGIGFKAEVKGTDLVMNLGFSHPIKLAIPSDVKIVVEKSTITITGIDKEIVGHYSAKIRSYKKPEPYKGKGIRYDDEVVRRKEGKKTA